jgi:hypothetical protein
MGANFALNVNKNKQDKSDPTGWLTVSNQLANGDVDQVTLVLKAQSIRRLKAFASALNTCLNPFSWIPEAF